MNNLKSPRSAKYRQALYLIKENEDADITAEETTRNMKKKHDTKIDAFEFLKQADDVYHHNLQVFVEMLIADKLKEKDMAYKELKSDYDVSKNKARSSNWISNLQKQFI